MLARNQEAELRRHNPAFGIMSVFTAAVPCALLLPSRGDVLRRK